MKKSALLTLFICFVFSGLFAQGYRVNITYTLPSALNVCGQPDTFTVTVQNISTSTVSGIKATVSMPAGVEYVTGSVIGTSVTESSTTNKSRPVFSLPNLGLAGSSTFKILARANCSIISLINSGGTAYDTLLVNYTGNYDVRVTNPYTIKIPNLVFSSISNQTITTAAGNTFIRKFTITNSGLGALKELKFRQVNGNGLSIISVNPGTHISNGDTIWTALDTTQFRSVGNGDPYLDYLESIEIIDTIYISGCSNFSSSFEAWWGCDNSICQRASSTGSVTLSSNVPSLYISSQTLVNSCYGGSGQQSKGVLRFLNYGTGSAQNVAMEVYQPITEFNALDTGTISYRKGINGARIKLSPSAITAATVTGAYACLGSGAIGRFVVTIPRIDPKDTIYLEWGMYSCCYRSCNSGGSTLRWDFKGSYKNACGNQNYTINAAVGNWGYSMGMTISSFTPSDIRTGTTQDFRYTINSYNLWPGDSTAEMEVVMNLPAALSVDTAFIIPSNGTAAWQYSSKTVSGNLTRMVFKNAVPFNLTQAELVLRMKADCSKGAGKIQNYSVNIYHRPTNACTDTCSFQIRCFSSTINIHCNTNCSGGMEFYGFSVKRSSMGAPDNNEDGQPDASGALDPLRIRQDRVMVGDTFEMVYKGLVRTNSTNSSWRYGYAQSRIGTYGQHIAVLDARVEIRKPNGVAFDCDSVKVSSSYTATQGTFNFDFSTTQLTGKSSGCFPSSYRFARNDTVYLKVRYRVKGNPGGVATTLNVLNDYFYLSNVQNPTNASDKFQCDTFSGSFTLVGYYFTNYGSDYYAVNGCNNITVYQNYYLSIGPCCSNYYGGNMFPAEYRNFAHLKKATMVIPTGYDYVSTNFYDYRTAGSGGYVTGYNLNQTPTYQNGDTLSFDASQFYDFNGGNLVPSDDGFAGTFAVTLKPNCTITPGVNLAVPTFFEYQNTWLDSLEAVGPGAQIDYLYYYPPDLDPIPALSTVSGVGDTVSWEVTVFNNSPTAPAGNVFLYGNTLSGARIVKVTDKTTGIAVIDSNNFFRLGNINNTQSRSFRVFAVYNSCARDSVEIQVGWGCNGYPKDINTLQCGSVIKKLHLYVEPVSTALQNIIVDSTTNVDLCASMPFRIEVYNINAPKVFKTRTQIELPVGMEIVPGSSQLLFPMSGSGRSIPDPVITTGLIYQWDIAAADTLVNKYGINGVADTSRNKYAITFRVRTNCDYASGSFFKVRSYGTLACGDQIAGPFSTSDYVNIKGITQPYFTAFFTSADSIQACSKQTINLSGKFINVGLDTTQQQDYLQVFLPPGLSYETGSFSSIHNAPANLVPNVTDFNGTTRLEWKISSGIAVGDSVNFSFRAIPSGNITCNSADVLFQGVTKQLVTCVTDGSTCLNNVITGLRNQTIKVDKGVISVNAIEGASRPLNALQERSSLRFSLQNSGGAIDTSSYLYFGVYYDADSTSTFTTTDVLLYKDSLRALPGAGGLYHYTDSFDFSAGNACRLLLVIDSPSCICRRVVRPFTVPLKNAGPDLFSCADQPFSIGLPGLNAYTYEWIPDSGFSNAFVANPLLTLSNTGSSVKTRTYLLKTGRGGCFNFDTVVVRVAPGMNLTLPADSNICYNDSIRLLPAFSGGRAPFVYTWSPATGMSDTTVLQPWVRPANSTTYYLQVTDSFGCTIRDSIRVNVKPRPAAKALALSQCNTYNVQFTDSSSSVSPLSSRYWDFGDGNSSTATHPLHTYSGFGTFTVKLTVTAQNGCTDDTSIQVNVLPIPKAGIALRSVCQRDSAVFRDSSSIGTGNITGYDWDFGDGNSSLLKDPKHFYAAAGTYRVKLKVTSAAGCTDTISQLISIYPAPQIKLSVNRVCWGNPTQIIDSSSIAAGFSLSRSIDLGDGSSDTARNILKTYTNPGMYRVKLTVTSSNGCTDTISNWVYVDPVPLAGFVASRECLRDNTRFTDTTLWAPADVAAWYWDFGDGNNSSLQHPTHLYTNPGTYTVKMAIRTLAACTDTAYGQVIVDPRPQVSFNAANVCLGDSTRFNNTSSIISGSIQRWLWDFGNGDTSSQAAPVYRYTQADTYQVSLKAWSDRTCVDSARISLQVYPRANPGFISTGNCQSYPLSFTDTTALSFSRYWDFGDGATDTGTIVHHTYLNPGTYRVMLKVQTTAGCEDSSIRFIQVDPLPRAGFYTAPVCLVDSAVFNDTSSISSGSIQRWEWDFGDGATATLQHPKHLYSAPGTYTVWLKVWSGNNCPDSTSRTITVYPMPKAAFLGNSHCWGDSLRVSDWSTGHTQRRWSFGDGTTDTSQTPRKVYAFPGTYTLKLWVSNTFGCADSLLQTIYVHPQPKAGWVAANTCVYDSVRFTDTSSIAYGQIARWSWDFGDGDTSALANPVHLYNTPGVYAVNLRVFSDSGCISSQGRMITVFPQPQADFSSTVTCYGDSTYFSDASTISSGSIQSRSWEFGDGGSSTLQSPVHWYTAAGNYTVKLKIFSVDGCKDSISKTITVRDKPQAGFTAIYNCQRDSVYFSNTSSSAAGSISSYNWDFGDGQSSNLANPVHHYAVHGLYPVQLIITTSYGCKDTFTNQLRIYPNPQARIQAPQGICVPEVLQVADSSLIVAGSLVSRTWYFGDGTTDTNAISSHQYTLPGIYTLSLVVHSAAGCSDSVSQQVTIYPMPDANFSFGFNCIADNTQFADSTQLAFGNVVRWEWDFGDGSRDTVRQPNHQFPARGAYWVTLKVTTDGGCQDSVAKTVFIKPSPYAGFSYVSACSYDSIRFADTSVVMIGNIINWHWDFGDSTSSTLKNPAHLYAQSGNYNVTLTVGTDSGCTSVITRSIVVKELPQPKIAFSNTCEGDSTRFADSSVSLQSPIVSWRWNFGDGNIATQQDPVHFYSNPGTYTVRLWVQTASGCEDSTDTLIQVWNKPQANFTQVNNCVSDTIQFLNNSITTGSGGLIYYVWNYGDGSPEEVRLNGKHRYASPGTYTVSYRIVTLRGCRDTISKQVVVDPMPVAAFRLGNACVSEPVQFTDSSYVPGDTISNWLWDFGDGSTSTLQHPTHLYAGPGIYTVKLKAWSDEGCPDSTTRQVQVYHLPSIRFSVSAACEYDSARFFDNSYVLNGSLSRRVWYFGDGDSSLLANPAHLYAAPGNYRVKLEIESGQGCIDSAVFSMPVFYKPVADFRVASVCQSDTAQFLNSSFMPGGTDPLNSWYWDFGDGDTSSLQHPAHHYTQPGIYTVNLIVSSTRGCKDTVSRSIRIHPLPEPGFTAAYACDYDTVYLADTSHIANGRIVSRIWKMGDGTQYLDSVVKHRYAFPGTYGVTLLVFSDSGCVDSITQLLRIDPKPLSAFIIADICLDDSARFLDASLAGPNTTLANWKWYFGDGDSSSIQHPVHKYNSPGNYQVIQIVSNTGGCRDTSTQQITIHPEPQAGFTSSPVCLPDSMLFNDTSSLAYGQILLRLWDFGDGDTATGAQVAHQYLLPGTYQVKLKIQTDKGCVDSIIQPVIVYPLPQIRYTVQAACAYDSARFFDNSYVTYGGVAGRTWYFGDGDSSNQQHPTHHYTTPGNYRVVLKVRSSFGCEDSAVFSMPVYPQPLARFSTANTCLADSVYFRDSSSVAAPYTINAYTWYFGDGDSSKLQHPAHRYADPGTYTVTQIVSSNYGCKDTQVQQVTVYPLPAPGFVANLNCVYTPSTFTDTSVISEGYISRRTWYFGDGSSDTGSVVSHLYSSAGTYTLKLVLESDRGCKDSLLHTVAIPYRPIAAFRIDTVCLGAATGFTDLSFVSSALINRWEWSFGDGQTDTVQNPQHIYAAPGTYTVRLIVHCDQGCSDTAYAQAVVHPLPQPYWSAQSGCTYDPVLFFDSSTISSGFLQRRNWDFGDGTTDTAQNPSHLYAQAGNYKVTLQLWSDQGCTESLSRWIRVKPQSNPAIWALNVCVSDSALLQDTATVAPGISIQSRVWFLGDGNTASGKTVRHKYASPGSYNVILISTTDSGCADTAYHTLTIYDQPRVAFTYQNQCDGDSIYFSDSSAVSYGSLRAFSWDFGDGSQDTGYTVAHLYAAPGTYSVRLKVSSTLGCEDSITRTVRIYALPDARPSAIRTCEGAVTLFGDSSVSAEGRIIAWNWDFGDGNSSSLQHPAHTYAQEGQYRVRLRITTEYGCEQTDSIFVIVDDKPLAAFSYSTACQDIPALFTDNSSVINDSIVSWTWNFGDGNSSSLQYPLHSFDTSGFFNVSLVVNSSRGCADTLLQRIYVPARPIPAVRISNACANDSFQLEDISSVDSGSIVSYQWTLPGGLTYTTPNLKAFMGMPGTYPFTLQISSDFGCSATLTDSFTIYPVPEPAFSLQAACLYDSVVVTDSSRISSGALSLITWDFGDGTLDTGFRVAHLYALPGTYTIRQKVFSQIGCVDSSSRQVNLPPLPVSGFRYTAACFEDSVYFLDTSSISSGNLNGRLWDFGDGTTSTFAAPAHYYAASGNYMVKLKVWSDRGCMDSILQPVLVFDKPLVNAQFNNGCEQRPVAFRDQSTVTAANIIAWKWYFGDGDSSYLQHPVHTYAQDSVYQIRLQVWTNQGCTDTGSFLIQISDKPKADFSAPAICRYDSLHFTDLSTVKNALIQSWYWDFGDGNTSITQHPVHFYQQAGNYKVFLRVSSDKGCEDTISKWITVYPVPAVAFDVLPAQGCEPLTVAFRNRSSISDGTPLNYTWDFGDGSSSTEQDPIHLYRNAGSYDVKLLVRSSQSCTDSLLQTAAVIVYVTPKAGFLLNEDTLSFLNPIIQVQDTSLPNITGREWDFGNGDRSVQAALAYAYPDTGNYRLQLVVYNAGGCSDTAYRPVWIKPDFTFFIPNAFTPNADIRNSDFKPQGIFKGIVQYEMQVYNRWGQVLFQTKDLNQGWNGQLHNNGEAVQEGVYLYNIFFFDYYGKAHTYQGSITLLR